MHKYNVPNSLHYNNVFLVYCALRDILSLYFLIQSSLSQCSCAFVIGDCILASLIPEMPSKCLEDCL